MNKVVSGGYIALTTLSILGLIMLIVVSSGFGTSVSRNRATLAMRSTAEVRNLIESCVEEVLLTIFETNTVPANVILPEGECIAQELARNGSVIDIQVTGSIDNYSHSVELSVDSAAPMRITSWVE